MKLKIGKIMVVVAACMCLVACGNAAGSKTTEEKTDATQESTEEEKTEEAAGGSYLGTWGVTAADVDGAKLSIEEIKSMDEDYYSDFYIIFKKDGKAVLLDEGTSEIVDWAENNGWLKIGEKTVEYKDGEIVIDYYGDKVYMKKISDSQDLTEVMEMTGQNEREVTLEVPNDYVEITDIDTSKLKLEDGEIEGELGYKIHITESYIDKYSEYSYQEIYLSFYDEDGNILDESSVSTSLEYQRDYTAEKSENVYLWCDKEVAEVRVDKIVISK